MSRPADPLAALQAQRDALVVAERILALRNFDRQIQSFMHWDRKGLLEADPYAWNAETLAAVWEASKTVPDETTICLHHLATPNPAWWHFEQPLPVRTTIENAPLVGLLMSCISPEVPQSPALALALGLMGRVGGLRISAWNIPVREDPVWSTVVPSQIFYWRVGQSLGDLVENARQEWRKLYLPGGAMYGKPTIGEAAFVQATREIASFMFAAHAWMNQEIVVPSALCLCNRDRRSRAKFAKVSQEAVAKLRIIHLRRREQEPHEHEAQAQQQAGGRVYEHRWVVSGHWRLQPFGPKRGERRLVYIGPYPKGPEGKPWLDKLTKVFAVDR